VSSVRVIFDILLAAGPHDAVLFHCRGGKDRTGMVSALVLHALGVTPEEILADFMLGSGDLTGKRVREDLAAIIEQETLESLTDEALFSLAGVRREWLDTLVTRIEERFGSVTGYLTDHVGIGERGIARLREMYLEPAED
jgi:protein-tyrosine phosphatase